MIKLRPHKITDAEKFFKILTNPNFKFFTANPKSVGQERKWIKDSKKKKLEKHFAITLNGKLVGGCGFKIHPYWPHIAELGYFIDEAHWGKGIATKAVKLLEKIAFKKLKRLEIRVDPRNKGSVRVAEKCGYKKEGIIKKAVSLHGKYCDAIMYAKVK